MAPNESKYSYCVIWRKADKKFNVRDDEWGDIFQARHFRGRTDEQEKLINAAFEQIKKRNKKFQRDDCSVLKLDVHFKFSDVNVPEPFEPDEPHP